MFWGENDAMKKLDYYCYGCACNCCACMFVLCGYIEVMNMLLCRLVQFMCSNQSINVCESRFMNEFVFKKTAAMNVFVVRI